MQSLNLPTKVASKEEEKYVCVVVYILQGNFVASLSQHYKKKYVATQEEEEYYIYLYIIIIVVISCSISGNFTMETQVSTKCCLPSFLQLLLVLVVRIDWLEYKFFVVN